jgi:hypothetical protein
VRELLGDGFTVRNDAGMVTKAALTDHSSGCLGPRSGKAPSEVVVPEEACPGTGGPTDQVRAKVALRIHCPDVLGAIAQLVEHLLGRQGVRGSSPLSSTQRTPRSEGSLW